MSGIENREAIIRSVAAQHDIDADLILELLDLERSHSNLRAHGAKGRLRRAAEAIIDAHYGPSAATPA